MEFLKRTGYSRKVIELYANQVNVGVLEDSDVALVYTGYCGDTVKLYLKINKDHVIIDAKFQYLGCPALAACMSILTQIIEEKRLQEAYEMTRDDLLTELDGLPDQECHCAELAVTTLHKAIIKYEEKEI